MNVMRRLVAFVLMLVAAFMLVAAAISTLGPAERIALVVGAGLLIWLGIWLQRRATPAAPGL